MMKAKIYITPKKTVLDPQGGAIKNALSALNFSGINDVRMGKYLEISLNSKTKDEAKNQINMMCKKLLVNPVIEEFRYEIE